MTNVYALTGGVGGGKSTVGELLQKRHSDIYFFDSDKVAKEILIEPKNSEKIKNILGEDIFINKKVDKQKVAEIIFNNPNKKIALENFIHPKVWEKLIDIIKKSNNKTIFLVESAILFEIGKDKDFEKIIVATCDIKERKRRLKKIGWSEKQIEERMKNQLPDEYKKEKALIVINTNCELKELEEKTEKLYEYMKNGSNDKLVL